MDYGLSIKKLNQIPDRTKQEIVCAVRECMKHVNVFSNGLAIIYGESQMACRKRYRRRLDIEDRAVTIAIETGADFYEVKERFMQEMRDLRFIYGV